MAKKPCKRCPKNKCKNCPVKMKIFFQIIDKNFDTAIMLPIIHHEIKNTWIMQAFMEMNVEIVITPYADSGWIHCVQSKDFQKEALVILNGF